MRRFVVCSVLPVGAFCLAVFVVFGLDPLIAYWDSGFRGIVVDVRTGRPVADVELHNHASDDSATTAADGSFKLVITRS